MPKYIAVFYETKRYERIIEAKSLEDAADKASYSDMEDCNEDNEYYDWELVDLKAIKNDLQTNA